MIVADVTEDEPITVLVGHEGPLKVRVASDPSINLIVGAGLPGPAGPPGPPGVG